MTQQNQPGVPPPDAILTQMLTCLIVSLREQLLS